jgi:hypothetical protein
MLLRRIVVSSLRCIGYGFQFVGANLVFARSYADN